MSQAQTGGVPDRLGRATATLGAYIEASAQRDRYLLNSRYIDGVRRQAVSARGTIDRLTNCVPAGIPLETRQVRGWQETAHEALTTVLQMESPDQDLETAVKAVAEEANEMLAAAREQWRSIVDEATVPVRSHLEMAERLQDHPAAKKARDSLNRVQGLRVADPSPVEKRLIEQAVADATGGLRALIGDHPAVEEFVKAACSGGAPLAELAGAVEEWLENSGMKDRFRVVYGAAPRIKPA